MILRSEAIALRLRPHSRTSQIVTWLTPAHGRVTTLIKGACRPKSPFLGQYDLFYTCELLFYRREADALTIARECAPLAPRPFLRRHWPAAAAASAAADLTARTAPPGVPQPGVYRLFSAFLDALAAGDPPLPLLLWFELQLARALGVPPRFDQCVACDERLPPDAPGRFDPGRGGILCDTCPGGPDARPLDSSTLAGLRSWLKTGAPGGPRPALASEPERMLEWAALFGIFLERHLEVTPRSRTIAFDLLTGSVAVKTKGWIA